MSFMDQAKSCKRRLSRQPMQYAARFRFSNEAAQDGVITDFSTEGLFLQLAASAKSVHLKPRQSTRLMIALQLKNHVLKFLGQVTRHTPSGLGVKFVNCDPKKLALATQLMHDAHYNVATHSRLANQGQQSKPAKPSLSPSVPTHKHGAHSPSYANTDVPTTNQATKHHPGAQKLRRAMGDALSQTLTAQMALVLRNTKSQISQQADGANNLFESSNDWSHDRNVLNQNGCMLVDQFLADTLKGFKEYLRGFRPQMPLHKKPVTQFSQLSLLSEQEMKKSVLHLSEAKAQERASEGPVFELTLRLTTQLGTDQHRALPIGPTQIAEIFVSKLHELPLSEGAQDIIMQHFNQHCIGMLDKLYDKLNALLVDHGGKKDIRTDANWQRRMRSSIHANYEAASRQKHTPKKP